MNFMRLTAVCLLGFSAFASQDSHADNPYLREVSRSGCGFFYNYDGNREVCEGYSYCIAYSDGSYLGAARTYSSNNRASVYNAFLSTDCGDRSSRINPYLVSVNSSGCGFFHNYDGNRDVCEGYSYCIANADGSYLGASRTYSSNDRASVYSAFSRCVGNKR